MKLQGWQVAGKAWTGLIGSLLAFATPAVVEASTNLPSPWPAVIAAIVAVATALGVYKAPYAPVGQPEASGNPWPSD